MSSIDISSAWPLSSFPISIKSSPLSLPPPSLSTIVLTTTSLLFRHARLPRISVLTSSTIPSVLLSTHEIHTHIFLLPIAMLILFSPTSVPWGAYGSH
ncbi:hypothetical protein C8J57DRAFT_1518903 [Mycena rebaudengoi]|nr:hypothetical protein C8J57DRAFT_1518903 [Mycena rebaudengoi]